MHTSPAGQVMQVIEPPHPSEVGLHEGFVTLAHVFGVQHELFPTQT